MAALKKLAAATAKVVRDGIMSEIPAIFKTQPLTAEELAIAIGLPALVMAGVEFEKWLTRRGWIHRN